MSDPTRCDLGLTEDAEHCRGTPCGSCTASVAAWVDVDDLVPAFVQGAQFWEWRKNGATMWNQDGRLCEVEAVRRAEEGTLGCDAIHSRP